MQVPIEATAVSRWFERLLAELGFEVWIADPAEIKAKRVKKRKTDREDAKFLLKLMGEGPQDRRSLAPSSNMHNSLHEP